MKRETDAHVLPGDVWVWEYEFEGNRWPDILLFLDSKKNDRYYHCVDLTTGKYSKKGHAKAMPIVQGWKRIAP